MADLGAVNVDITWDSDVVQMIAATFTEMRERLSALEALPGVAEALRLQWHLCEKCGQYHNADTTCAIGKP